MTIKPNEVYTFKLTSGEELIGKVTRVDTDWIEVSDPLSVAPGPQGMGLIPSVFTIKPGSTVQINTRAINMYADTEEAIKAKYTETTTGISLPSKKLILG
jgi:hypothetical protein